MGKIRSLNTVLALSISIVIMCIVIPAVIWISSSTYQSTVDTQEKAMGNLVLATMNSLNDYLNEMTGLGKMFASQRGVRVALQVGKVSDAQSFIDGMVKELPEVWAAFVFDSSGYITAGKDAQGNDLTGKQVDSEDYFDPTLAAGDLLVSHVIRTPANGAPATFVVSAPVKDAKGTVLGGICIMANWDNFTKENIDSYRIGKEGYGFMIDGSGRFIAHAMEKDLLFKDMSNSPFIQQALQEKKGAIPYEFEGRQKLLVCDTNPQTGWVILMSAYEDDLAETAINQRNGLIIGGIAVIVIVIGILLFVLRRIVLTPIKWTIEFATKVAHGDLNARLDHNYRYEFAILSEEIQIMVAELKNKLGFAQGVLNGLAIPSGIVGPDFKTLWLNKRMCELLEKDQDPEAYYGLPSGQFFYNDPSRATLSDKAIKERHRQEAESSTRLPSGKEISVFITTTPFFDMDGNLLGSLTNWLDLTDIRNQQKKIEEQNVKISRAASEADAISQNLTSAADELSAQVEEASRGAEAQRDRMTETAAAMNQMNTSVLEVARNASDAADFTTNAKQQASTGSNNLKSLIEMIQEVHQHAIGLKDSMQELGNQAQGIGNILNVISDIADQTNLLALNAAIEAARAGEAGRGFAVVADEVRKLAEKTMDATREVGGAVTSIQSVADLNIQATNKAADRIADSTELAGKSGEVLRQIVELMESAAAQVSGIAAAAEEQSATSEQINRSIDEVNSLSGQTSEVMVQSTTAVQEVARMAAQLTKVIEEMS